MYYSRYRAAKKSYIIFAHLADGNLHQHFHVEVFREKKAPKRYLAEEFTPLKDLHKVIDQAIGNKSSMDVTCGFSVPTNKLPDNGLVRGSALGVTAQGVELRTVAMEIEVSGGPINLIRWRSRDSGKSTHVTLHATLQGIIEFNYLDIFQVAMCEYFQDLVLDQGTGDEELA